MKRGKIGKIPKDDGAKRPGRDILLANRFSSAEQLEFVGKLSPTRRASEGIAVFPVALLGVGLVFVSTTEFSDIPTKPSRELRKKIAGESHRQPRKTRVVILEEFPQVF